MTWIDLHNDVLWNMAKLPADPLVPGSALHADLPRLLSAGVRLAVWAVFVEPEEESPRATAEAFERLETAGRLLAVAPDRLVPVRDAVDVAALMGGGGGQACERHGMMLAIEGLHPLCGSLEPLDRAHAMGVRLVTLTWNHGNAFATGCRHPQAAAQGLSRLGRDLLDRLGTRGIILDLAHAGPRTLCEALDEAPGPVMVSHTACRALVDHPRNLTDDELRRVAGRGGVVGITVYPGFLRPRDEDATSRDVAAHIAHAVRVAGPACVTLGTDFDGITSTPSDLPGIEALPLLARALEDAGLDRADIEAVAWRNADRFLQQALRGPGGHVGGEGG